MGNKHELRGGVTITPVFFGTKFRAAMINQAYTDVHVTLSM